MKFGVREICDVVFKAKAPMKIGTAEFKAGQPVLYIDTATASTLEQSATTVYAQGGKGNARLIAWEGEKTVTFTVTDALLSPIGMSILAGAGLFKGQSSETVHVHSTASAYADSTGKVDLSAALNTGEKIDDTAPVFVMETDEDGSLTGTMLTGFTVDSDKTALTSSSSNADKLVFVDFYVAKNAANVSEIQIEASSFGGFFYVEASTLFRQSNGVDMPAEITLPNVKIQSNFTFSMAATGDPSTFDFVMDAFPGYTMFDRTKKVQCVIQIIEEDIADTSAHKSVMPHTAGFSIAESENDSTVAKGEPPVEG